MQKKIIALAVAGLMSGAAFAQSNVTIYGVVHSSWDSINTDVTKQDKLRRVGNNFSRIGFKGTEALGNGLAANWQLEQGFNVDGENNASAAGANVAAVAPGLNSRNTFVGLSSKTLGEVRLGHHDTPYKMSTGGLDVFGDTGGDYNVIMGYSNVDAALRFDQRDTSSVLYLSPIWNGLQVTAHYSHRNERGNDGATATTDRDNPYRWSAAATYTNGPLFATLAYEKSRESGSILSTATTGHRDDTAWKFGIGYTFMGTTKVGFVYENLDSDASTDMYAAAGAGTHLGRAMGALTAAQHRELQEDLRDRNNWGVNIAHTMGNIVLKGAYMRASDSDANGFNDSAKNWTVGIDYNMSKRTQVYALYTKTNNDRNAQYGLGHGFYGGCGTTVAVTGCAQGDDPRAVSFGLKHSF